MKMAALLSLLLFSLSAYGDASLCKPVKSSGDEHWPIPEKAFTQERALNALKTLRELINSTSILADFVSVENELLYVKGHFLKKYAEDKDTAMINEFCAFLETEAYVRH